MNFVNLSKLQGQFISAFVPFKSRVFFDFIPLMWYTVDIYTLAGGNS